MMLYKLVNKTLDKIHFQCFMNQQILLLIQ